MQTIRLDYPIPTNKVYRCVPNKTKAGSLRVSSRKPRRKTPASLMKLSEEARAWKAKAIVDIASQNPVKIDGYVRLICIFHPKLTKKGVASKKMPDIDGSWKLAIDALQGYCFENDRQVKGRTEDIGDPKPGGGLTIIVMKYKGRLDIKKILDM